jgi:NADPH-dependent 2,4-dienoyl-CoA reductase/sulfur reductase-like enzyme
MRTFHEAAREVPVLGEYDVVVCGGGPAGFVAAVSAARGGARTLLIERYGFLGGTATAGLMVEFGPIHDGEKVLVGGAAHEFLHRLIDHGGAHVHDAQTHAMTFDPESMIAVCQEMVLDAGAEMLLHTWIAEAIVDEGRVVGVIVENKSGRGAVLGKVLIDATGDGDVAARAGAGFDIGHDRPDVMQPVTLELILGNVDTTAVPESHHDVTPMIRGAGSEGWPIPTERILSWGPVEKRGAPSDPQRGWFFINATNVLGVNGLDAQDLTRAEIGTRRQVAPLVEFFRRHVPGFESCYLDRTAAQVGIRETRRIRCLYTLTRDDVLSGRHFADGVVPGCNSIDVHDVAGRDFEHEFLRPGSYYEIPYRCFLPEHLDGLLVTGRCLGADYRALGSARVMVVCMPMGDACGRAAAMAARAGKSPREIDVTALRAALSAEGTVLGA